MEAPLYCQYYAVTNAHREMNRPIKPTNRQTTCVDDNFNYSSILVQIFSLPRLGDSELPRQHGHCGLCCLPEQPSAVLVDTAGSTVLQQRGCVPVGLCRVQVNFCASYFFLHCSGKSALNSKSWERD